MRGLALLALVGSATGFVGVTPLPAARRARLAKLSSAVDNAPPPAPPPSSSRVGGGTGGGLGVDGACDVAAWRRGYSNAEELESYEIDASGFPSDLVGTLFRNGPAKFVVGEDKVMHPFDGDGMMSAVTLRGDGTGAVRHRFVRTKGCVCSCSLRPATYLPTAAALSNCRDAHHRCAAGT